MKKIRAEWILLAIAVVFVGFLGGLAVGQRLTEDGLRITAERPAAQAEQRLGGDRERTETVTESTEAVTLPPAEPQTPTAPLSADAPLNINTATAQELTALPGIGEVLAQRIVDYRAQKGAFTDIRELELVEGIGSKRLDAISDYITVEEQP